MSPGCPPDCECRQGGASPAPARKVNQKMAREMAMVALDDYGRTGKPLVDRVAAAILAAIDLELDA